MRPRLLRGTGGRRFAIVTITRDGYVARDTYGAPDVLHALREFVRRCFADDRLRMSNNAIVLRDGATGKRYSMREAADSIPGMPWWWWSRGCDPSLVLAAVENAQAVTA